MGAAITSLNRLSRVSHRNPVCIMHSTLRVKIVSAFHDRKIQTTNSALTAYWFERIQVQARIVCIHTLNSAHLRIGAFLVSSFVATHQFPLSHTWNFHRENHGMHRTRIASEKLFFIEHDLNRTSCNQCWKLERPKHLIQESPLDPASTFEQRL